MRVPILMYHRVGREAGDRQYTLPPRLFEAQMRFLAKRGYRVISLDVLLEALDGRDGLPSNALAITFDDGFEETYRYAPPILKRFGFPATFFLVTRRMGQTSAWMEQLNDSAARLMSWSQAETLAADGFTLGSHTATHPSLIELDEKTAFQEMAGSKRELEDRLGRPIRFFAYPYGHFGDRVRALVREAGYDAACSTRSGFNTLEADRYALRRLNVSGRSPLRKFRRCMTFGQGGMTSADLLRYYVRRGISRLSAARAAHRTH